MSISTNVKVNRFKLLERSDKRKAMEYYRTFTREERLYMAALRMKQEWGK